MDLAKNSELVSDAKGVTLFVVPAAVAEKPFKPSKKVKGAANMFRDWSQQQPQDLFEHAVRLGKDELVGRARVITYRSDKWTGKPEEYEHIFDEPGPRVVRSGQVIRISGNGVRVTPAGVDG